MNGFAQDQSRMGMFFYLIFYILQYLSITVYGPADFLTLTTYFK